MDDIVALESFLKSEDSIFLNGQEVIKLRTIGKQIKAAVGQPVLLVHGRHYWRESRPHTYADLAFTDEAFDYTLGLVQPGELTVGDIGTNYEIAIPSSTGYYSDDVWNWRTFEGGLSFSAFMFSKFAERECDCNYPGFENDHPELLNGRREYCNRKKDSLQIHTGPSQIVDAFRERGIDRVFAERYVSALLDTVKRAGPIFSDREFRRYA